MILSDSASVLVSASIGDNEVTIYGYTSPNSRVELTGINIYALDFSDDTGYFEFNKLVLPKNPPELCLQSKDISTLTSSFFCLPSPPATNYHTNIGPVILSPTISLSDNATSGQSIPNSIIDVYFYKIKKPSYSLPKIETTTDINGNYSINIPTIYPSGYRFYTSVKYQNNLSPKSNTLLYNKENQFNYFILIIPLILFLLIIFAVYRFLRQQTKKIPLIKTRYLPALPIYYSDINKFVKLN